MIIDFYAHFGYGPGLSEYCSAENLSALARAADIDLAVAADLGEAFGDGPKVSDPPPGNIVRFAGLNPESDLHGLDSSIKGIRIYPTYQAWDFDGKMAADLVSFAQERSLIVQLCLRIQDPRALPQISTPAAVIRQLDRVVKANSDVRFVISGANCSEVSGNAQFFSQQNVWADISHVQHPINSLIKIVNSMGSPRLLFGSGAPVLYPYMGVFRVLNSPVSIEDRERILEGNAKKLLEGAV